MRFTMSGFPANHNALTIMEIAGLASLSEEVGFDRFGVTDYPFHHDCVAVMTACLLQTERLQVESLVTTPYHRPPDATACAWATMDDISPGRVILGLGRGVPSTQLWSAALDGVGPVDAMDDVIRVCREMWAGEVPKEVHLPVAGLKLDLPVAAPLPILIAARGPQMLRLAAEQSEIVHLALPFLGPNFTNASIAWVRRCAEEAGRDPDDVEIDLTVAWSVLRDGRLARDLSKLLALTTIILAADVWRTAGATFGLQPEAWADDFPVSPEVLEAVRRLWEGAPERRTSGIPDEIADLITDDVLAAVGIAGEPDEAFTQLVEFVPKVPGLTGIRYKLPPLPGPESRAQFEEMIVHAGQASDLIRSGEPV